MYTPEEYEAKRRAKYERFVELAEKAEKESEATWQQARLMADVIPMGQPILVGHYSEKSDRNYRARIDSKYRKGYELHQKAAYYASRAESTQDNDAIYSDDPNATDKLSDKIAALEAQQEQYKAINKAHAAYLKNPASLDKCELPEGIKNTIRNYKPAYSWEPHPIAPFQLTNLSANIRRLKERAQHVEKKQALHDEDFENNGVRIEGRPSENRIRLYFGKRVDMETYKALKSHGFRVLRSEGEGAFSAYYNNNALELARTYIKKEG
jgi:hypothetical protein